MRERYSPGEATAMLRRWCAVPSPDRLSALDAAVLDIETARAPMHVGWTLRFDGPAPSLAELRRHVDSRLGAVPRFRRRVVAAPAGLGDLRWVDDAGFDIARHVHSMALGSPSGDAQLRDLVGVLLSTPLDPRRPLWRLNLVTAVGPRGGFALVGQAHHALVDGLAALEVALLLLDPAGSVPRRDAAADTWIAQPDAGPMRAAGAAASMRLGGGADLAQALLRAAALGAGPARSAAALLTSLAGQTPKTSLDQSLTRERRVAFADIPLRALRDGTRRHGATINDGLLAAATLAVGAALRRRGEHHESVRAVVPASVRHAGEHAADHGNRISFLAVDLPVGERDPAAVLRIVRARTRSRKLSGEAGAGDALLRAADLLPGAGRRQIARTAARAANFTVIVSNVPGPESGLELLGCRLVAAYPAVPLLDGHGLTIGALSHAGTLHAGVFADAVVVPDATRLGRDLGAALREIAALPAAADTPWRARARERRRRDVA